MVTWLNITDRVEGDQSALNKYSERVIRPIYFVKIEFLDTQNNNNFLYVNSSMFDIDFIDDSGTPKAYVGAGAIGSIETIQEGYDLQVYGIKLSLSGIPAVYSNYVLNTKYRDRKCVIWLALFDDSLSLITKSCVFSGWINDMKYIYGDCSMVEVVAENAMIIWERPCNFKYSHQDQLNRYPGDNGLKYVSDMVDKEVKWGWAR